MLPGVTQWGMGKQLLLSCGLLFCFTFMFLLLCYEAHITNYKNINHESINHFELNKAAEDTMFRAGGPGAT